MTTRVFASLEGVLREQIARSPRDTPSWCALADLLLERGDDAEAASLRWVVDGFYGRATGPLAEMVNWLGKAAPASARKDGVWSYYWLRFLPPSSTSQETVMSPPRPLHRLMGGDEAWGFFKTEAEAYWIVIQALLAAREEFYAYIHYKDDP